MRVFPAQAARMAALKRGVAPSPADAVEDDAEEEAKAAADLAEDPTPATPPPPGAQGTPDASADVAADWDGDEWADEADDDDDDGDAGSHREAEQAAQSLRGIGGPDDVGEDGQPAWQRELDAFQAELGRRGEAGEDLSFLRDPSAPEPPWVTQLLASRALENFFSAETVAELDAQRDAREAAEERRARGESVPDDESDGDSDWEHEHDQEGLEGGSLEEGYSSMEELLAALTRERGEEAAQRATIVYGPEPPPPSASAR
jgi:hypothetical protein